MSRRSMKLRLKAVARGELTQLTLTGVFASAMTLERRRRLLALASLWSRDGLDVVLAVDDESPLEWCDGWTDALDSVRRPLSVHFELFGHASPRDADER